MYSYDQYAGSAAATTGIIFMLVLFVLLPLVLYVLTSFFQMRLFAKAGVAGWKAWIPYVREWALFEIGGFRGALSLLLTLPGLVFYVVVIIGFLFFGLSLRNLELFLSVFAIVGILLVLLSLVEIAGVVLSCIAAYHIGLKLGKSGGFVVLYIFLSPVWLGICGLDRSTFNDALSPRPTQGNARLGGSLAHTQSFAPAQPAQGYAPTQQYQSLPATQAQERSAPRAVYSQDPSKTTADMLAVGSDFVEADTTILGGRAPAPATAAAPRAAAKPTGATLTRRDTGERIPITHSQFTIGRSQGVSNYYVTGQSSVSREHALIVFENGKHYLVDQGSRNHSFVNGQRLQPKRGKVLANGDRIKLADIEFVFNV